MRGRVSTRAHDRAVTDGAALKIPRTLESAIDAAVSRHLEAELGDRSLLLTSADLAIAEAKTAILGRRLMTSVLKQCYPEADGLTVEFERTGDIGRIGAALAFGAVTSRVFASSVGDRSRRQAAIELLCGTFNLAIGLVDGICDADVATGEQLLDHFHDADLVGAASHRRGPGWLHAEMPLFLAADDGVAFTISVTEAFFENLHNIYADNADVRRIVGEQLADALKAETASVRRPLTALSAERRIDAPEQLRYCPSRSSRRSRPPVVPHRQRERCWAKRCGVSTILSTSLMTPVTDALNAVLLDASALRGMQDRYEIADLQAVLASSRIASAAAEAADRLRDGLRLAGVDNGDHHTSFSLCSAMQVSTRRHDCDGASIPAAHELHQRGVLDRSLMQRGNVEGADAGSPAASRPVRPGRSRLTTDRIEGCVLVVTSEASWSSG